MSADIVERLRARASANKIVDLLDDRANDLLAKETDVLVIAAGEIESLRAVEDAYRRLLRETEDKAMSLRAEVEALREPVEDSAAFRLRFPGEVKKIQEEARDELRSEVEALRLDAERYRWWRRNWTFLQSDCLTLQSSRPRDFVRNGDLLDGQTDVWIEREVTCRAGSGRP